MIVKNKKKKGENMKISMSRFKHKPKEMECCNECKDKVCNISPVKCIDFFIANKKVLDEIRSELDEKN
jgi:hypothetical protein